MRIKQTKEIKNYLKRLQSNIDANYQNDYLDGYVEPSVEKEAIKEIIASGEQDKIDSLFINKEEYINNPYLKNIDFKKCNQKGFSYETVTIEKGYLFNIDEIQDDKDKELKDYMILRAYRDDVEMPFLKQKDKEWMMASISEFRTNDPYAKMAHGKVLTFGLGIGYFVYMALLNEKVESITVIEREKDVIELFNLIKDKFPNKPIKIINGDAFNYFNEDFIKQFDFTYVDIYQNNEDGREIITKLLEQYLPDFDTCKFWIENSCLSIIKTLIYIYYNDAYHNKKTKLDKSYQPLMNKVRKYLDGIDKEIDDVNTLKEMMYDKKIIREILHTTV